MTELRKDYLTSEWVSISSSRAKRPTVSDGMSEDCPFCPQNRHMLPGILYDNCGVLSVPNMYPILSGEEGYHEVIIDTPGHNDKLHELDVKQITETLKCIKQRMLCHSQNDKIKYIQVFKNNGTEAGASIAHPHWQLLAMQFIPPRIENIINNALKYEKENNEFYFNDLIKNIGPRKIIENEAFIAYIPYAPKFGYEVDLLAKKRQGFMDFNDEELSLFAGLLKKILYALTQIINKLDYNILFYNIPSHNFYAQIIPRQGRVAGCELSAGLYTSSVYPEVSVEEIKNNLRN